jgi:hypothetical protein
MPSNSLPAGKLTIQSPSLDLTPAFDFAEKLGSADEPAAPESAEPAPPSKPGPINLPVRRIEVAASLSSVLLREVAATNVNAGFLITSNRIRIQPFKFTLNGGPVDASTDLDFGQQDWKYQLALNAHGIALEPLVNSFAPELTGQYRGQLDATANISGTGVTPEAMSSSLAGRATFTFTNAQVQILNPRYRRLLAPIATVLRVNLDGSPLNWFTAHTLVTNGQVRPEVALQSAAFEARLAGDLALAPDPRKTSLNLPVDFRLSRSLAERTGLVPANAPTNAAYVELPRFVTLAGTIGEPTTDLDERRLGGVLLKSGVSIAEKLGVNVDGQTGNALQKLGNVLTGEKTKAGTNAPAGTNTLAPLLDRLLPKRSD